MGGDSVRRRVANSTIKKAISDALLYICNGGRSSSVPNTSQQFPVNEKNVEDSQVGEDTTIKGVSKNVKIGDEKDKGNKNVGELPAPITLRSKGIPPPLMALNIKPTVGVGVKPAVPKMAGKFAASTNEKKRNIFQTNRALATMEFVSKNRAVWAGPTKESNWVLPGRLLVGAYPYSWENNSDHVKLHMKDLHKILGVGVTSFVCLQSEYVCCDSVLSTAQLEQASRKKNKVVKLPGPYASNFIFPYIQDASQISGKKERHERELRFLHLPIVDLSYTEDSYVYALAFHIVHCLAHNSDEIFYVHCWGGHGRTGTLVAVILGLLFGISADEALERTQLYHNMRISKLQVRSPQTDEQCTQVRRILSSHQCKQGQNFFSQSHIPPPKKSRFERSIFPEYEQLTEDERKEEDDDIEIEPVITRKASPTSKRKLVFDNILPKRPAYDRKNNTRTLSPRERIVAHRKCKR